MIWVHRLVEAPSSRELLERKAVTAQRSFQLPIWKNPPQEHRQWQCHLSVFGRADLLSWEQKKAGTWRWAFTSPPHWAWMQIAVPYLQRPGPAVLYPLPIYLLLKSVLFESQFSSFCLLMFSLWHCPPSPVSAADKIFPLLFFPAFLHSLLCHLSLFQTSFCSPLVAGVLGTDIIPLTLNNYLFLGWYPAAAPQVTAETSDTQ